MTCQQVWLMATWWFSVAAFQPQTWVRESQGSELLHVSWILNAWRLISVKYYAAWMSYQDWWFETGEVNLICTQPVHSVLRWGLPLHMVSSSSTEWLQCAVVGQESRREMGSYIRVEGTSNSSGSVPNSVKRHSENWLCMTLLPSWLLDCAQGFANSHN